VLDVVHAGEVLAADMRQPVDAFPDQELE